MRKFAIVLGMMALSIPAFAQEKAPMTGVWNCKMKVDGGAIPDGDGTMDLQQSGKDIKGTGSNAGGSAPMKGTLEDAKVKLTAQAGDAPWEFEGKLDGNKFGGTWGIPAASIKGTYECSKTGGKAAAQEAMSLTGLWKCLAKAEGNPDGPFELDMVQKGEVLSGTGANAAGSAPLKGTFKDGKFQVKIDAGDIVYELEGTQDGDKIKGTLKIPAAGVNVKFEGLKAPKS